MVHALRKLFDSKNNGGIQRVAQNLFDSNIWIYFCQLYESIELRPTCPCLHLNDGRRFYTKRTSKFFLRHAVCFSNSLQTLTQ